MVLDFTRSILSLGIFCGSCLRRCAGTVNGLLTAIRQPGKYLLEHRDDVVLDDSCNNIYTHVYFANTESIREKTLYSIDF